MQFEFNYTFDEYREANRASTKRLKARSRWLALTAWAIVLAMAGALALLVYILIDAASSGFVSLRPQLPRVSLLVVALAIFFAGRLYATRRAWRSQPLLQLHRRIWIDDEGLTVDTGQAKTQYRWNAFQEMIETKNLLLLFLSDHVFVMMPKRIASGQQLQELAGILRERVSPPVGGFPVLPVAGGR